MEFAELNRFINNLYHRIVFGKEITPASELIAAHTSRLCGGSNNSPQLRHFRTSFHGLHYDKWPPTARPTVLRFL